jgi:hypothetical protein
MGALRSSFVQNAKTEGKGGTFCCNQRKKSEIFKKLFTNGKFYGKIPFGCADNRKERIRRERI